MIKGAIVYNISQCADLRFSSQINAFLRAFNHLDVIIEKFSNLEIEKLSRNKYDFVFFWDKDIYAAYYLEAKGYLLINKAETIQFCDDKALTYIRFMQYGIPAPRTYVLPLVFHDNVYQYSQEILANIQDFGYPVVVKERMGSFGEQVYLAENEEKLLEIIKDKGNKSLLIQEYIISQNRGEDYRINVVDGKVAACVKRINENDFRSNVNQGGKMLQYEVTQEIMHLAVKAAKAVNADFCGVDIIVDENNKPFVIEVNSNARTLAVFQTTEIDLTVEIAQSIVKKLGESK